MRRTPHGEGHDRIMYGALLDAVRGLRWHARRPSRIAVPGIHQSRVRGTSAEFTEYRPYRQGDDLRRIDWKLFARSDRAYVRTSEERAVTPTYLILDASASMSFPAADSARVGDGAGSKWELAQQLAVALTAVALAGGDPAGVTIAGHSRATIQPRTSSAVVGEVMRMLHQVSAGGAFPLAPAVMLAARSATRIAIISDFLGDADDTLRAVGELAAAGRDVHAVHVIAREELDPPGAMTAVMDPEVEDVRRTFSGDTRAGYARAFADWRAEVAARLLASGVAYRVIITGAEPVSHTVRRIVRDESVGSRAV